MPASAIRKSPLLLLLSAATRSRLRWARRHVYSWLILGPLVIGLTYATAARIADNVSDLDHPPDSMLALAILFSVCLIGLSLSRASAEIYHVRRAESSLDALPLEPETHFHAALIIRVLRTAAAAATAFALLSLFDTIGMTEWRTVPSLIIFIAAIAIAEVFAAINWIHWSHKNDTPVAVASAFGLVITVLLAGRVLAGIGTTRFTLLGGVSIEVITAIWSVGLYSLARYAHRSWRAADLEYSRRLRSVIWRSIFGSRLIKGRFRSRVASQLARDLQLTLRTFSSAVYVVGTLTFLFVAALVVALITGLVPADGIDYRGAGGDRWLAAIQSPQVAAIKSGTVLAVSSMCGLVPVLVAYTLPHLWLERAVGVSGLDIWEGKIWYARLMSFPVPIVAWAFGAATGSVPAFYIMPLLGECLLLWWGISSLIGSLSFEMPARPGLAAVLMMTAGAGAGLASALTLLSSLMLPIGVPLYAIAMHSLSQRGRQRARYYLLTEED